MCSFRYLASCIILYPASGSWIEVPPLPMGGRSNFGMVRVFFWYSIHLALISCELQALLQETLFIVWGGSSLQPAYADAALFNATALTWTPVAPLLQARSWSGAASSSSRAFAVGGMSLVPFFDPMDSVEMCAPLLKDAKVAQPILRRTFQILNSKAFQILPMPSAAGFLLSPSPGVHCLRCRHQRGLEPLQHATARCTLPHVSTRPFVTLAFADILWEAPQMATSLTRCFLETFFGQLGRHFIQKHL